MHCIKRGGHILISFHYRSPDSPNRKIRQKLAALALERGFDPARPGAKSDQEMRTELAKWNGSMRVVKVAHWKELVVPARVLEDIEARIYSYVWLIPPEVRKELMFPLRDWAGEEFGDLSRPMPSPIG